MANKPVMMLGSSVGIMLESTPGVKIMLTSGSAWMDLLNANAQYNSIKYEAPAMMGTRELHKDFEAVSHYDGKIELSTRARWDYMDELLKAVLGSVAGTVYTPIKDNTELPTYTIEANLASLNNVRLIGCKVNKCILKSVAGEPLTIDLDFVAQSGERNVVDLAVPSYTNTLAGLLFMHSNTIITASGATWLSTNSVLSTIKSIELEMSNKLAIDDFTNSTSRAFISEGMFESKLKLNVPYNATTKGFWAAVAALDIVTLTIAWSNGTHTITAVITARCETELPDIGDLGGKFIDLEFKPVISAFTGASVTITLA